MKNIFLLLILILSNSMVAEVLLPNGLFGNNMVLQRSRPIAVFGKATPEKKVTITFKGKNYITPVIEGYWKVFLDPSEAGGPFELTISGKNIIVYKNILVGEVWLCSGQSNMEMPLKGFKGQPVNGSNLAILQSKNANLRFFKVPKKMAKDKTEKLYGSWEESAQESAPNFSATAYFFGNLLQKTLGVPVGLINSSWGGTPAEAWTPKEIIENDFSNFTDWNKDPKRKHRNPNLLYNAMIHPLIPYTIKGAIWYQGEGNVKRAQQYQRLFPAMIQSWRENWAQGDFPFYFVQIAPFGKSKNHPFLREAQLKTMLHTENTGMVVTLDIGNETVIHPPEKRMVGERLAYWALAKDYGFNSLSFSGPVYKSMKVSNNKVFLFFDAAKMGLTSMGNVLKDFEIAGEDKVFYPAKAQIKKGDLVVWSDQVKKPVAVRYAWKAYVKGSLFSASGLPASSFRTDHW